MVDPPTITYSPAYTYSSGPWTACCLRNPLPSLPARPPPRIYVEGHGSRESSPFFFKWLFSFPRVTWALYVVPLFIHQVFPFECFPSNRTILGPFEGRLTSPLKPDLPQPRVNPPPFTLETELPPPSLRPPPGHGGRKGESA